MGGWMVRLLRAVALVGLALCMTAAHAQQHDELTRLSAEVSRLHGQGKYADAIPVAERYIATARREHGEQHPEFANAVGRLGSIYQAAGRFAEAEPLLKRSLAIIEKALGSDHALFTVSLNNLAHLYWAQGLFTEAEPLLKRGLAVIEKALGPDHALAAGPLNNLAEVYRAQGRFAEAEPLFKRSLVSREKALGPDHTLVSLSLSNLAGLYKAQGRYAEAEPLLRRSLAIREKALAPDHPDLVLPLNNLAVLFLEQGRFTEAEPFSKRSLAIIEKALGLDHPLVGSSLNNLAELYRMQGHYADAEPFYRRSLAVREKALGPDHPEVAVSLINLAGLLLNQGRFAEAEPVAKRSVAIREKALGADHPEVGQSLSGLAGLYRAQGRYTDAEPLSRRGLSIIEKALGPDHPEVGVSLRNLAELYGNLGRLTEAEPLFVRTLAIHEKVWGPENLQVSHSLNDLARLSVARSDLARAADFWRRSTGIIERRAERGLAGAAEGSSKAEAQRWRSQFTGLVRVMHRLTAEGLAPRSAPADMFETAQWVQGSDAAETLAQMATRSAKGSPQLAALVRERQDLVNEWRGRGKLLIAAKSQEPAKRNASSETAIADQLAAIDTRLAQVGRRLAQDFPDYAALASPAPMSVAEVQGQLGADETLVLFLDTSEWKPLPEETFVWVVTRSDARWVRSDLGTAALTREVGALRCGLDAATWDGEGAGKCATALGIPAVKGAPSPLPFDHARAHRLYSALFGEVQDLIKGKHLLIVPSGPLTQLPFQVLVTKAPADGVRPGGSDPRAQPSVVGGKDEKVKVGAMGSDPQGLTPVDPAGHRAAAWLAREHAITVLPAVSSLKALRRVGRPSAAQRPMIGVGNPLLDGPDARSAERARLARASQRCPETLRPWKVTVTGHRPGVARVETRGGLADLAHLKALAPLPETTGELCDVAHDVKADVARDLRLGSRATEREVKRLSTSGELAQYRMLHFATHGALAGELDGYHEPGLVLTPPETASEEDDGYLSASEIAALKLDADWVVLSACNTAAGAAKNAEALSGLGRAFIYAGARALLVSHWAVDSDATVKLVTGAVREMARDAKVGRAEALRRSMLALIDKGTQEESHPAYWAPFVVVGEGAAGR